jgi:hypothetical protein
MTQIRRFLLAAAMALPFLSFAQVSIKGEMRLGDTTQVHILHTTQGDRLVGRVIGFSQDSLSFLFKNTSQLQFALKEIKMVEVQGAVGVPSPGTVAVEKRPVRPATGSDFIYMVQTGSGEENGRLNSLDRASVKLDRNTGPDEYIPWRQVKRINLISGRIDTSSTIPSRLHVLRTTRSDRFVGQLLEFDGAIYRFLLENGDVLEFDKEKVRSVKLENPNSSASRAPVQGEPEYVPMNGREKIMYSPTGFRLKKNQYEYQNVGIFYNTIDYGASDNVTIGASISTVLVASLASLRLKVGADLSKFVHISAGGQAFGGFAIGDASFSLLMGYAAVSIGSEDRFINFGIAKGKPSDEDAFTGYTLGGSIRVAKNWRLIGEFIRMGDGLDQFGILTLGASWFNKKHRIDFGLSGAPLTEEDTTIALPIAAYAYRF